MSRKNWGLTVILIILVGIYIFMLSDGPAISTQETTVELSLADTSAITSISLQAAEQPALQLARASRGWVVNDSIPVDGRYMQLLQSVLAKVEAVRPVAASQYAAIDQQLQQQGTQVRVETPGQTLSFVAGGDAESQVSYFKQGDQIYVVQLPGYNSYLSGLFNQAVEQIRSRTIYNLNSNNFLGLQLTYPERPERDFEIIFRDNRLGVADMDAPDSLTLFGYMSLFEPVEAQTYVDQAQGRELTRNTQPLVKIKARSVSNLEGKELWIYPQQTQQGGQLAYLPAEQQYLVLEGRLARALMLSRQNLKEGIK